jgi:hypothetical protein
MTPQELQNLLDDLEPFRASRKSAWENLAENIWARGAEFRCLLERLGGVRAQLPDLW